MLLVFLAIAVVFAQNTQSLSNAYNSRVYLTKQQAPTFSALPTANEQQFVFKSSSTGYGTELFSTSTGSSSPNQQVLLSQPKFAFGQGAIGSMLKSPDESYILFDALVESSSPGVPTTQYSVGITGGGITRITPPVIAGNTVASVSSYSFKPCSGAACSGSDSSAFYGLFPTAVGAGNTPIFEIWVNDRAGNAKRINLPLLQGAGLAVTKQVSLQRVWSDFFLYQANPGVREEFDSRRFFLADWTGANWLASPLNNFATFRNSTSASILRSYSSCNPNGRYIAISDYVVTNTYRQVTIYDIQEKKLLTITGAPDFDANTTVTGSPSLLGFSPDEKKFYYQANPAGTFSQNIYEIDLTSGATKIVNSVNPFAASGNTTSVSVVGGGLSTIGDYFMFTVSTVALPADVQTALFSYNWKTGAAAQQLYITPNGGMNPAFSMSWVYDVAGERTLGQSDGGSPTWSNTATTFFTSDNSKQLWVVPVAGGSATRLLNDDLNVFTAIRGQTCGSALDTNYCKLASSACSCSGCKTTRCGSYTWVTVRYNNTSTTLQAINYNGQNIAAATPAGGQLVSIVTSYLPVPNSNSDVPTIVFTSFTGALTPTDNTTTNLYAHTPGSAAQLLNSQAPLQNWQGGGVRQVKFSTSGYIAFQLNTNALFPAQWEQYVVATPGSKNTLASTKVSPALIYGTSNDLNLGGFARQTLSGNGASVQWTSSGKYLIFVINDNNQVSREQRGQLFAWEAGAGLSAVNLTVNSNASEVNSIPNDFTNFQWHCNQETLLYQTSLPELASPSGVFSVPLKGGQTVALGFEPSSGGAVSSFGVFRGSFRVWFRSNYFGNTADLFVNTASAAFLLPSIALVLLALFL